MWKCRTVSVNKLSCLLSTLQALICVNPLKTAFLRPYEYLQKVREDISDGS